MNEDSVDEEKEAMEAEEGVQTAVEEEVETAASLDAEQAEEGAIDQKEEEVDPLEALQAEADKWRDVALRATADLENYRKRMAREKTDAIRYANSGLLETLLPVIDNFEWGLQAAKADAESSSIYQGMSMVFKQITDFLASEGVEAVKTEGEKFDPNMHDAISQEPNDTVPEGVVISQSRKGYRLRDRLLRPAGVIVSTGPADGEVSAD